MSVPVAGADQRRRRRVDPHGGPQAAGPAQDDVLGVVRPRLADLLLHDVGGDAAARAASSRVVVARRPARLGGRATP